MSDLPPVTPTAPPPPLMAPWVCFACHGPPMESQPIDDLAATLNQQFPDLNFQIVGGTDPQIFHFTIRRQVTEALGAGSQVIFIGHGKGAALAYYISDLSPTLTIAIDPPGLGSNIAQAPWMVAGASQPGLWRALGSARFVNIYQDTPPGGGQLLNQGANYENYLINDSDHLAIVNDPATVAVVITEISAITATPTPMRRIPK